MKLALWFDFDDIQPEFQRDMQELVGKASSAAEMALGKPDEFYNVIVSSDSLVQQLNRDFRNKNSLTDVISFPLGQEEEVTGEIYLCWSRVLSQAKDYGHGWQREFSFLLVHGILHLSGYEHGEDPCPEMRAMEERILEVMEKGSEHLAGQNTPR